MEMRLLSKATSVLHGSCVDTLTYKEITSSYKEKEKQQP